MHSWFWPNPLQAAEDDYLGHRRKMEVKASLVEHKFGLTAVEVLKIAFHEFD
jgi:hypothetical protein